MNHDPTFLDLRDWSTTQVAVTEMVTGDRPRFMTSLQPLSRVIRFVRVRGGAHDSREVEGETLVVPYWLSLMNDDEDVSTR